MRRESLHPLIRLTIDGLAREFGVAPTVLWDALDGKPSPPRFVKALVDAYAPGLTEADFVIEGLSSRPKNGTLRTMSATGIEAPQKGRPLEHGGHELIKALKKAGVTLAEAAKEVKRSTASVRSWLYPVGDTSFRPIPRACAEHFRDKYKVPLATWPRITD